LSTSDKAIFVLIHRIATFLSVVFHPLIITTYLFALLFLITPDLVGVSALELPAIGSLLLLIFLNTFVASAVIIYYFHRFGLVSSLHVDNLRERRLPYLVTIVIYAFATYLFGWQLQPIGELAPQISIILAGVTLSLIFVGIVSLVWKISAHATGIGGALGMIAALLMRFDESLLFTPLLIATVIGGFLASARLYLNAHTPAQVVAGITGGLAIGIGTVFFFL
jgi:membrane-associated phospholipid phosphatase